MKSKLLLFVVLLLLVSCGAPRYTNVTPDMRAQILSEFKAGTLVLTDDSLSTDLNFIQAKYDIARAFVDERWENMVILIMKNGHMKDISYFLLGVAAEKMGYLPAALRYYQYAAALYSDRYTSHHCREYNECMGINLAMYIPKLIAQVEGKMKRQREQEADAIRQALEASQKKQNKKRSVSVPTPHPTSQPPEVAQPKASPEPRGADQTDPLLAASMRDILKQSNAGQPQTTAPPAPAPAVASQAPAPQSNTPVVNDGNKPVSITMQPLETQSPPQDAPKKAKKDKKEYEYSE